MINSKKQEPEHQPTQHGISYVSCRGLPCLGFPEELLRDIEFQQVFVPYIVFGGVTYQGAYVNLERRERGEFAIVAVGTQPHCMTKA